MLSKLFHTKLWIYIEIGYLIVFPLILISFIPSLYLFRFFVMVGSLLYIFLVARLLKVSMRDIGFMGSARSGWKSTLFITSIFSTVMYLAYLVYPDAYRVPSFVLDGRYVTGVSWFVYYVLLSAPLQEIIFRGFYIARLEKVEKNKKHLIFISSAVFAAIHIPFHSIIITSACLALGMILGWHFLKHRNIYAVIFMHAIVGVLFGSFYFS
jgi:membrane protease YdiL (CAAX protease family)